MENRMTVPMNQSLAVQENIVLPGDTNAHDTMFGGLLMKRIDETAAISARRHCRGSVVTASNDGVHFHRPIQRDDIVVLESYLRRCFDSVVTLDGRPGYWPDCGGSTSQITVFVKSLIFNSIAPFEKSSRQ